MGDAACPCDLTPDDAGVGADDALAAAPGDAAATVAATVAAGELLGEILAKTRFFSFAL